MGCFDQNGISMNQGEGRLDSELHMPPVSPCCRLFMHIDSKFYGLQKKYLIPCNREANSTSALRISSFKNAHVSLFTENTYFLLFMSMG
jgi:hypothetical protein